MRSGQTALRLHLSGKIHDIPIIRFGHGKDQSLAKDDCQVSGRWARFFWTVCPPCIAWRECHGLGRALASDGFHGDAGRKEDAERNMGIGRQRVGSKAKKALVQEMKGGLRGLEDTLVFARRGK